MKQKPSFQFYQQDFLGSVDVKTMTTEQVGCYCLLLFNCYNNGGELPSDENKLRMLCHGTTVAEDVLKKFYKNGEFLRNKRVDEELKKQAKFSKTQSDNARKRWNKPKTNVSDGNAMASNRQCSSSSTSSSTLKKEKIYKKDDLENPLWHRFCDNCEVVGIQNKVKPDLYLKTLDEYSPKCNVSNQVKECLYWCKEKGHKQITLMRIRNWLKKHLEFQKQAELKQMTAKQDQQFKKPFKDTPVWTPPE